MMRDRALKVLLVFVGVVCVAAAYVLVKSLLGQWDMPQGDQMILGIYVPLGVFLLLAARDPSANRTLILAVAWANLSHAVVMAIQGMEHPSRAPSGPVGLAIMALVSVGLLALAARRPDRRAATPAPVPAPAA